MNPDNSWNESPPFEAPALSVELSNCVNCGKYPESDFVGVPSPPLTINLYHGFIMAGIFLRHAYVFAEEQRQYCGLGTTIPTASEQYVVNPYPW